ncbi:hypothetical protein KIW84_076403 [Lathyrus oleraceus]|uniref:Uncharacterized protein n=1 Tax=Pisum sativum TaxID=3888 RepID=A0A9D4VWE2_PEA|nr:hypothetical protein KIW84_076403 [Pisum sativum]
MFVSKRKRHHTRAKDLDFKVENVKNETSSFKKKKVPSEMSNISKVMDNTDANCHGFKHEIEGTTGGKYMKTNDGTRRVVKSSKIEVNTVSISVKALVQTPEIAPVLAERSSFELQSQHVSASLSQNTTVKKNDQPQSTPVELDASSNSNIVAETEYTSSDFCCNSNTTRVLILHMNSITAHAIVHACWPVLALWLQKKKIAEWLKEPNFTNRVDESSSVSSFLPEKLMQYLKDLSKFPTGGFDRLELLIVKAQLLAFYRLEGYSYLPGFQYFRGLDNDINLSINDTDKRLSKVNEHTIHVGRIGDQTGEVLSSTCNEVGHNLTYLELDNNHSTSLIPPESGYSKKLALMNLAENQLTVALPPELGNFVSLQVLKLRMNKLNGATLSVYKQVKVKFWPSDHP